MQKISIVIGILIFILVTIIVLSADNSGTKKVQFTNQNFVINHENTEVASKDVTINLDKTEIKNTELKTENKNIDIQNNDLKISNTDTNLQNTNYSNQNVDFDSQNSNYNNAGTSFENQNTEIDQQLSDYESQKAKLKTIENSLKNQKTKTANRNSNRYLVKNIDWSTWKSNFVNKIIDDSIYIRELDEYGIGTWFYYSFTVNSAGGIYNIKVTSPYLLKEDCQKIEQLIKGYEYQDITVFPANSKRQTANVKAIVLLGDTEKKAKPSDFKDMEKIKITLPN